MKIVNTVNFDDIPEASRILSQEWDLISLPPLREVVLPEMLEARAYISSASLRVDKDFLLASPDLEVIASPSTGKDHIDLELLEARGIVLLDIATEYELLEGFTATSELVFSLMLAIVRNLMPAAANAEAGIWSREKLSGTQLFGKTFGTLGLGRLGKISAKIANCFGMNVIANDLKDVSAPNVTMVSFSELLSESDFLSIHIHLNEENEKLIGSFEFEQMKKNCVLINTSRGKIIDEDALLWALKNKTIFGAGLDVIDGEWLSDKDMQNHQLISFARESNNLLIVPHIGGSTRESITGARVFIANKLSKFLKINYPNEVV